MTEDEDAEAEKARDLANRFLDLAAGSTRFNTIAALAAALTGLAKDAGWTLEKVQWILGTA